MLAAQGKSRACEANPVEKELLRDTAQSCILPCMKQLNLNVTPEFERDLESFMKSRRIARKSAAVRQALREAAVRSAGESEYDFRAWLGLGLKAAPARKRRFRSEDDLWS